MGQLRIAALLLVGFVAVTTLVWFSDLATDPLRKIPGPPHKNLGIVKGPIVQLAPNKYSISCLDAVKTIYGPGNRFKKAGFYHAFGNPDEEAADLFSELNSERHASKRRKVASLYTMTSLVSYEPLVDRVTLDLDWTLSGFAAETTAFHAPLWMHFYAFDVIGESTVGKAFGYLQAGRDFSGIIQALHESNQYACRIGLSPWLHPELGALMKMIKAPIPFDAISTCINKHIKAGKEEMSEVEGRDFLQKLLPTWKEQKLDSLDIFCWTGANIATGSDTTATSLSTIIYYLARNPSVLDNL